MSLARRANYSQAGFQATLSGDRYEIRDNVQIKDGTAGALRAVYQGGEQDEALKERSFIPGLRPLQAILILVCIAVILTVIYIDRQRSITRLALEISRTNEEVNALYAENAQLEFELKAQMEESRIDYEAMQVLGMIPQEEAELYTVFAPNPRPFEHQTKTAAGI